VGVEQDLGRIAAALEWLVAHHASLTPSAPSAPSSSPELGRLRAALAKVETEAQAVNLWSKAMPTLADAERPAAWRELVAHLHGRRGLAETETSLRAAVAAAAPKTAVAPKTAAPMAPRGAGRAR
jgi:hypothetical protein